MHFVYKMCFLTAFFWGKQMDQNRCRSLVTLKSLRLFKPTETVEVCPPCTFPSVLLRRGAFGWMRANLFAVVLLVRSGCAGGRRQGGVVIVVILGGVYQQASPPVLSA